ncbi:MAG TPA: S41 family peptidase [Stellaceae bacterium]|nr:S41 family peptidase [Stellaceae bacterium]
MRGLAAAVLVVALGVPGSVLAQENPHPNLGPLPGGSAYAKFADKETVYEDLNLFDEAFERIQHDAVDPVSSAKLIGAAITGMLSGLDPHAAYLDPAAYKALAGPAKTGSDTIGLAVSLADGQLRVISPRDGSPAAKAGLLPGDLIFTIDKEPTFAMTLPQAEERLSGPPGSKVALTVLRGDSSKPLHITVTRAAYQLQTVTARIEAGNIGYIRIASFDAGTVAGLTSALQSLRQQTSDKLVGLVLDLRNDPGGNFDAAIKTANAFLDKGDIAVVKGRAANADKHIAAKPGKDVAKGLPIVALIDGGTAREAELVAGALHDNHRAVLVGTKSFGDGAIETLIPLDSGGAIRLTTSRFLTPGGTEIQGKGITPDLTVTPVKVETLVSAETLHEADLPGALKNPDAAASKPQASAAPAHHGPAVATSEIGSKKDAQLTEAVDVLRGLAVYSRRASG